MQSQSSEEGEGKRSEGRKPRRKSASRPSGPRSTGDRRRRKPAAQAEYDQFVESYGSVADINVVAKDAASAERVPKSPARPRGADLAQTGLGLFLQGCSLTAALLVPGILLVLWTYGYMDTGMLRLSWLVIIPALAATLVGEWMCLAIAPESRADQVARAALVCSGLTLAGLTLSLLIPYKGVVLAWILDIGNFVVILARMYLSTLFLSRVSSYAQEPVYETRSVFAMTGVLLVTVAIYGFLRFAPAITEETTFAVKAVVTGIQWWIIVTAVAVAVMYISILLGMGRSLRRRST